MKGTLKISKRDLDQYLPKLSLLEDFHDSIFRISNINTGREVDSWRMEYGSYYFTNIGMRLSALLRILPRSKLYDKSKYEIWDLVTVYSFTRVLIESYYKYFHFIIEDLSDIERSVRETLYDLIDIDIRYKSLKKLNPKSTNISIIEDKRNRLKSKIEANEYYKSQKYTKKDLENFLWHGGFDDNQTIASKAGIAQKYHQMIYKQLSHFVHSGPMAISHLKNSARGQQGWMGAFSLPLDFSAAYLSFVLRDAPTIMLDCENQISRQLALKIREWISIVAEFDTYGE